MNLIIIEGRIGKEPEASNIGGSKKVTFSVATTESFKNKNGERKYQTEWHRVEAWGTQGDFIEKNFHLGDPIIVQGSLHTNNYEKDGIKKSITYIRPDRVMFPSRKKEERNDFSYGKSIPYENDGFQW